MRKILELSVGVAIQVNKIKIKNMAQRRMFSPEIVCSDAFLDMPSSSRDLYYQLGMYADDDGFVNPRKIMRMISSSEDDLKILIAKRFVLSFPSGVLVVKHWNILDVTQRCPASRHLPLLPKIEVYVSKEDLKTIDELIIQEQGHLRILLELKAKL